MGLIFGLKRMTVGQEKFTAGPDKRSMSSVILAERGGGLIICFIRFENLNTSLMKQMFYIEDTRCWK